MTGSEDFNVYLWRVPKLNKDHVGIAKVEQSSLALEGHRSIVNQVIFNRDTGMMCSSGVEKIIKVRFTVTCRYFNCENNILCIRDVMSLGVICTELKLCL